jgi:hypothetical protein
MCPAEKVAMSYTVKSRGKEGSFRNPAKNGLSSKGPKSFLRHVALLIMMRKFS